MRKVGGRRTRLPAAFPSAGALHAAAIHQRTEDALSAISTTGIAKGIYRYASHEEMNRHTDEALARTVALNIEGLLKTKQTTRDKDKLDRSILERALSELKNEA